MTSKTIADRAEFDIIRYAQLWEDADVLCAAMGEVQGGTLVSICSGGDNALALLTLDPAQVIAVDLSPAQIACLELRRGAYTHLHHPEFLELMGARPSTRRANLLTKALTDAAPDIRDFWEGLTGEVIAHGAGGVGKFERYFRLFKSYVLPLTHSKATRQALFAPRPRAARAQFFEQRFNTWRWRAMMRLFFSRFMMGRLGRDKAFFDHVEGSVADHVSGRLWHAAVETDPSQNPYLHWIFNATHGEALPLAWRAENYAVIRARLDRIQPHLGAIEALDVASVAGFNLSDIFEYMDEPAMEALYGHLLSTAQPGARLVYWNMMAPRRVPASLAHGVTRLQDLEDDLKARDKAFFYSDFVVEEVTG